MPYTVQSSEKLKKSGSEMETKALLYLMNFNEDSSEIFYFVVDLFNDLTGMNRTARKMWDLQSKAAKNNSPKAIGRELVTLYKNYISDFEFGAYYLFMGGVSATVRKDDSKNIFGIDNLTDKALSAVIAGLKDECGDKVYISDSDIDDNKINDFLHKVRFVVDDKAPEEYVKKIIINHPQLIPEDDALLTIFNEIRDKQSSKKNICVVENVTLNRVDEALDFYRHLTSSEIKLMVLQRLLNRDILEKGVPEPFIDIYTRCPVERRQDLLDDCKSDCCRALFNNNCADGYWSFFECIYKLITEDSSRTVSEVYDLVPNEILNACVDFNATSYKYFIAIVKEGLKP